jgi:hypothetical protein
MPQIGDARRGRPSSTHGQGKCACAAFRAGTPHRGCLALSASLRMRCPGEECSKHQHVSGPLRAKPELASRRAWLRAADRERQSSWVPGCQRAVELSLRRKAPPSCRTHPVEAACNPPTTAPLLRLFAAVSAATPWPWNSLSAPVWQLSLLALPALSVALWRRRDGYGSGVTKGPHLAQVPVVPRRRHEKTATRNEG